MCQLVHRFCLVSRLVLLLSLISLGLGTPRHRLSAGVFRNGAVGGVSIDADGVLKQPTARRDTGPATGDRSAAAGGAGGHRYRA